MRVGVDTNVLIRAHVPGLEGHGEARAWLMEQLAQPDVTLVVTPLVLHELIHVITDGRRFDPPVPMSEALAIARAYVGRTNVECLAADEPSLLTALDLLGRYRLGRKRIADTLLAATLLTHGVHRLATYNTSDFELFDGLTVAEPGTIIPT